MTRLEFASSKVEEKRELLDAAREEREAAHVKMFSAQEDLFEALDNLDNFDKCSTCGCQLDMSDPCSAECGGDCRGCMADAGDPDCILALAEAGIVRPVHCIGEGR